MSKRKPLDVDAIQSVAGAPVKPIKQLEARATGIAPSRAGKVQVGTFVTEKKRKTLKLIGIEQDKTVGELMEEALDDLFEKYNKLT